MADNVTAPATGQVFSTDDIGGVQFPRSKITLGDDGVDNGTVSAANPLPMVELSTVIDGAAAQTAVINNILPATSGAAGTACENFRSGAVQVVSTGTGGTFIFEQSLDGTNWVPLPVFNAALVTAVPITAAIAATASAIIYTFPLRGRQVRLRIASTITGGSIRAFTRFSSEPWTATAQLVASNTAANLNATISGTVAVSSFPATPTANILNSAATTNGTVVKASAGTLFSVTISNTNAAARFVKLYNSTTVTVGTTAVALTIPVPPTSTITVNFGPQGMRFGTGICLSTTAAAADADTTAVAAGEIKVLTSFT